tara:strand:+ start:335 stop:1357 length:1023 start_codon:yes stop_codon:yes gene_type:complete
MNFKTTDYKLILLPLSIILISVVLLYFSIISTKIICSDCKFEVKKNESAYQIAYRLVDMDIINEPYSFLIASKLLFLDTSIKPGKYNLSDINSVKGLLLRLTDPSYDYISVTIPEGWNIKQIARKLHQSDLVDSIRFNDLCSDKKFISTLDIGSIKYLEGYLFPETYFISSNQTENEIITMMVNQFKKIVNLDKSDYQKHGFSFQDLIILASIIQGEAMDIDEMPTVSSVFHNRLNKKMFLDANATIQYIIPGKNRRLMNKDLEIDNLYNTYKHKGLPPGPINNPGLDAIIAASKPLETDYFYFVKDPDNFGKHVFNETFKGHEIARRKYLRSVRINGFK